MVAAKKGGQRVGYIRVSSIDQNTVRQLEGVELDEKFTDKASGKDTHRPALQAALKHLRKGDVLVVHSMDRLARNLRDLLKLVEELNGRGVAIEFIKERLEFTGDDSPTSKLMLAVMGATAEFERDMIKERQREGIAAAKARGERLGRKPILNAKQVKELRKRVASARRQMPLRKFVSYPERSLARAGTLLSALKNASRECDAVVCDGVGSRPAQEAEPRN